MIHVKYRRKGKKKPQTVRNGTFCGFLSLKWRTGGDSNDSSFILSEIEKSLCGHDAAAIAAVLPELKKIIAVWPDLPQSVRTAILLLTEREEHR